MKVSLEIEKKKNIILSPSSLRTLSELPVNPSLSTLSSSNNDKNYYLSQSNKLSTFIKEHYQKYNKYPPTSVHYYKYGRQRRRKRTLGHVPVPVFI